MTVLKVNHMKLNSKCERLQLVQQGPNMSTLSVRLKSLATNQTTTIYPTEVRYVLRKRERDGRWNS